MEQPPEVVAVLEKIVGAVPDDERRAIEQANLRPVDTGIHEGDPEEQPDQTP